MLLEIYNIQNDTKVCYCNHSNVKTIIFGMLLQMYNIQDDIKLSVTVTTAMLKLQ